MIWDLYLKELMLMFSYKFSLILFWSKSKWIWFTPSALKSQIYHLSLFSKFLFWAGFRFQHFFDSIFFDVELLYLRISIFWAIFDFWLSTSIFYVRLPAFSVQSFPSLWFFFFSTSLSHFWHTPSRFVCPGFTTARCGLSGETFWMFKYS